MPPSPLRRTLAATLFAVALPALLAQTADHPRFTPEISEFVKNFKPGGQDFNGQATVLPPEESVRRFVVPEGYVAELVASEPEVRQPIDLRFDERGRLWVVQYLQYPFPAGLTVTSYDQYIRAEFDRVSPPPPRHFRGADKITVHEDKDGDGKFETHRTFVDGLNMATSVLPGDGGVWVLMSPYLLFYPDKDGNDVPDGDPEVHLTGFGLEDTHSLASSLHWGPDGWIYGATGSTTNLEIQGVRLLGQGIWRYHPGTKVFEVFAEGGGNTFSLEFDQYGRAFSGTNNGATRGLHYAQGATYVKNWPKHGPAMSPFIFGFFEHMAHEGYSPRFAQTIILYEGGAIPALEGQIISGMSLTNRVQASTVHATTSTFRTKDTVALVTTDDKAFRPVDIEQGPDGAIYLADWTDLRLSHLNPKDNWDKSNGRIMRLVAKDQPRPAPLNLRTLPTAELVRLLGHPNREHREQARRLLAHRPEAIAGELRALVQGNAPSALEAFWVLNLRGELDETGLRAALGHPNAHLRRWAVRLFGDAGSVPPATLAELRALARRETDPEVRSQLASSAKRLPAGQAFPLIRELLRRDEDASDQHLPLLVWWAIESKAESGREELLELVRDPAVWQSRLFSTQLAERIGMRFTADQGPRRHYTLKQGVYSEWMVDRAPEHLSRNLEFCARLVAAVPSPTQAALLINGMARGMTGGRVETVPAALRETLARAWSTTPRPTPLVALAARLGQPGAETEAVARLRDPKLKDAEQQVLLDLFAALRTPEALPLLADLLKTEKNEARRTRRLSALGGYDAPAAADAVMDTYASLPARLQNAAQRLLSEKPTWATAMLQRLNAGAFNPGVLSSGNLALIRGHRDPRLTSLLTSYQQKHSDDPALQAAQKLFETGRVAYNLTCAPCHQESGTGLAMLAPSLIGSRWLQEADEVLARIVLHGKENPGRGLIMPPWRQLDDLQLASVLTYVRREFGNQPKPVDPATIAAVRTATADRQKAWTDTELDALPRRSP